VVRYIKNVENHSQAGLPSARRETGLERDNNMSLRVDSCINTKPSTLYVPTSLEPYPGGVKTRVFICQELHGECTKRRHTSIKTSGYGLSSTSRKENPVLGEMVSLLCMYMQSPGTPQTYVTQTPLMLLLNQFVKRL